MARMSGLRAVNSNRLADKAYEILRDSILRREFPPGYRLDFDELQDQLEISRTPLNEALSRLAAEGLVTPVPYRGTYVTELVAQDLAERFDIREILEVGISDLVVENLTDDKLDELHALYRRMDAMIGPSGELSDYVAFLETDMEFQRTIVGVANNQHLVRLCDGLNLKLHMAQVFYLDTDKRVAEVHQEHLDILRALTARDAGALRQAIRTHLGNAKAAVVARVMADADGQRSRKGKVYG